MVIASVEDQRLRERFLKRDFVRMKKSRMGVRSTKAKFTKKWTL